MIRKFVNDSPFNATENYLFVPVPYGTTDVTGEGFLGDVLNRFPQATFAYKDKLAEKAFEEGEVLIFGNSDRLWMPLYALAFAAIHQHAPRGWRNAPQAVTQALNNIPPRFWSADNTTIATAGIPGTGYSGLKGDAEPEAIKVAFDDHVKPITVYERKETPVREPLRALVPSDSDDRELASV